MMLNDMATGVTSHEYIPILGVNRTYRFDQLLEDIPYPALLTAVKSVEGCKLLPLSC